jgi:hypothetical protein
MSDNWFNLSITCHPNEFVEAFGCPRQLYKILSNSKKKIGYVPQRMFWKTYVSGGVYVGVPLTTTGEIQFTLLAKLKGDLSQGHLDYRFKSLVPPTLRSALTIKKEGCLDDSHFQISLQYFPYLLNPFGRYRGKHAELLEDIYGS